MDNPLKKLFSLGSIFEKTTDSAVGIDIGTSSIKVVEIKRKGGKAILETYGAISLGPYGELDVGKVTNLPAEKIAEALQEVLKQAGVNTNSAAFAIPMQSSLIFMIELPAQVKPSEIPSIIPIEARKYIPMAITEVSLDYFVLPERQATFEELNAPKTDGLTQEKTQVLVVATQNEAVTKFRSVVSACALEAPFFEIEVFSSVRANFEHELSLSLLMDFGASRTKIYLVEFGIVKSSHTINRGGVDLSNSIAQSLSIPFVEAEKMKKEFGLAAGGSDKNISDIIDVHLNYIFSEANSVLLGYEQKYSRTVSKVILSGGGAMLRGLKDKASENFKVEIEMGKAFSKVGAPAFLEKVLETVSPEFAVAMGLALRKLQ